MIDEIRIARRWIEQRPIFLDTETTGLDETAQACQIAVVDHDGTVLMDTLVRPTVRIPNTAIAIHGITNAMVQMAPAFSDLHGELFRVLHGRLVIVYNAAFDLRILNQSATAAGCPATFSTMGMVCAMLLYADYRGEYSEFHQGNRWFKLEIACALEHVPTTGIRAHQAVGDCELTRRLVTQMAYRSMPWEQQNAQAPLVTKGASA
jgi:DNA polymerase III subunit epsilon